MNLDKLTESYRKTRDTQRILLGALAFSALANTVLALGVMTQDTVVTMIPPTLRTESTVGFNFAETSYTEAWALYTAQTLGNVTPSNVKFLRTSIEPILSPQVHQAVIQQLERQAQNIRDNQVILMFEPRRIIREQETGKIFVHGQSVLESPSGDRSRAERTYEFQFRVLNYMPNLTHVDTYKGPPRTLEEIEKMKKLNRNRKPVQES